MRILARLLACLLALTALASAQGTIGVDPITRHYTVTPGQTVTQVLNIYNPNKTALRLKVAVYLMDMNISEVGESEFVPVGSVKESSGPWTTVSPSELDLGGQETKQVRYTIQVPANAAPGTHWAVLMFEGQEPAAVPGKTLASFRLRVGHTMYVHVQPMTTAGSVTGIFENVPKTDTGAYELAVQYTNSGNSAVAVQGRVELRDAAGTLVATLPLDIAVALPGRSLLLRSAWAGPVPKGQYTALVILNNGQKNKDILAEHVVTLPFDLKAAAPASATPTSPPPPPGAGSAGGSGGGRP
ncbi:hypothetical protein [Deinococcus sp. NW-56]|uniref:hypothetical protein n=1 Tax=Deinococcus sp. NW-56 TaxID=2080419 RepID=UPI000CF407E8|nr:hypothetical protein [Deinococcus sp. NW-56]